MHELPEQWFLYFVALPMAMLVVASAVYGLYWASRKGQLQDLEDGAKVIFDDEEPVGVPSDQVFHQKPSKSRKS